jgi:hypothetical protein
MFGQALTPLIDAILVDNGTSPFEGLFVYRTS